MDRLAEHHDVIAIDLPGFGESRPHRRGVQGVPALADAIREFLADQGVTRPHVAGNSLGGALTLELAAAGDAASATAFSPAGFASRTERWYALAVLLQHRMVTFAPSGLVRAVTGSPGGRKIAMGMIVGFPAEFDADRAFADAMAMRRGKGFVATARGLRRYGFAGTIDVPVTIAWGTRDRILIPRQADRARVALPDATHVPLPRCGHVPMGDDPDLVASTILATTQARANTQS